MKLISHTLSRLLGRFFVIFALFEELKYNVTEVILELL